MDFLADGFAFFAVGAHEFVIELEVHPQAGGDAEEGAEAKIVFGSAAAFALFHLGDVGCGDATAAGDLGLGQAGFLKRFAEGLSEEVEQRDELRFLFHGGGSVIVGDLNVGGVAVFPPEDNAPLLVDADTPESLEIAGERFEAVGRWLVELVDGNDPVKLTKSHERPWLNIAREFPGVFPMEDFRGFLAGEVLDHLR